MRSLVTASTFLALLVGAWGCKRERPSTAAPQALAVAVKNALATQANGGGATTFDLAEATSFAWDSAFVFDAYSWPDLVTKTLGFYWPGGADSATVYQDRYQLIVFTKEGRVAGWTDWDTVDGRFYVGRGPIAKGDARLHVWRTEYGLAIVRRGDGPPTLRIVGGPRVGGVAPWEAVRPRDGKALTRASEPRP